MSRYCRFTCQYCDPDRHDDGQGDRGRDRAQRVPEVVPQNLPENVVLEQHGVLKPARELRYRYALHLAEEERLDEYLAIYQQYYQGLQIARLDCLALQAELQAGKDYTQRAEEAEAYGDKGLVVQLEDMVRDETGHSEETARILEDWPL